MDSYNDRHSSTHSSSWQTRRCELDAGKDVSPPASESFKFHVSRFKLFVSDYGNSEVELVWSVWFVSFVWLQQMNQINQTNLQPEPLQPESLSRFIPLSLPP